MEKNEQLATELSNNREELMERISAAKEHLPKHLSKEFRGGKFDIPNKRFISKSGEYALQWMMRIYPYKPPSESNPQHKDGIVLIKSI